MRELGMTLFGVGLIATFFAVKIYPNLEYTGVGGGTLVMANVMKSMSESMAQ